MPGLNPDLFSDDKLRPEVRQHLLAAAAAYLEYIGVTLPVKDAVLTGSSAGYNSLKDSDIDVHLVFDAKRWMKDGEVDPLVQELMFAKKAAWAADHEVIVKGHPVELFAQPEKPYTEGAGVYSLLNDDWVQRQDQDASTQGDQAVEEEAREIATEAEQALQSDSLEHVKQLRDRLWQLRQDTIKGGEFSHGNLVYKRLRHIGVIDRLSDAEDNLLDKQLSLR